MKGVEEVYYPTGRIKTARLASGEMLTYNYSGSEGTGTLTKIEHNSGQKLTFTYDSNGRIKSFRDPSNALYSYGYDSSSNLTSVTYPTNDGTTHQKKYIYLSNNRLSGIIDENGFRFASWEYDGYSSKAISSYHGSNKERVEIVSVSAESGYSISERKAVRVKNALNKETTYHFQKN